MIVFQVNRLLGKLMANIHAGHLTGTSCKCLVDFLGYRTTVLFSFLSISVEFNTGLKYRIIQVFLQVFFAAVLVFSKHLLYRYRQTHTGMPYQSKSILVFSSILVRTASPRYQPVKNPSRLLLNVSTSY